MVRLGDYELLGEIGRGGAGVVHRAAAPGGRVVAIKVIPAERDLERARRELRLLAELGAEKGFVPVLDSGASPHGCFIVMPFMGGGTLRDKLRRGPLELAAAVELGRRLARALGEAHARGIVHRDLKPENVLFAEDGSPFVADLGLAKHFRRDAPGGALSLSLSQGGNFLGTIGYAPPEQLRDAKEVGPPGDVFALGAILHECLAGAPAFAGETPLAILDLVESGSHDSLDDARPGLPRHVVAAVERALAPDPAARFADGAAFAAALDAPPARSKRLVLAAVASLLVLVLALVLVLGRKNDPPAPRAPSPLPELCSGFAHGKILELEEVLGDYAWKTAGPIQALAWSPDGKRLLSAQGHWVGDDKVQWPDLYDKSVAVWDAETGNELARFKGHTQGVMACAFVGSGAVGVSGSWDGTLRFWATSTGRELEKLELGSPVRSIAVSGDGSLLLAGRDDGRIAWIDPVARALRETGPSEKTPVLCLALSADGKQGAWGGGNGHLAGWKDDRPGPVFEGPKPIRGLLLDPDGVTWGDDAGVIRTADRGTFGVEESSPLPSPIRGLARADGAIVSIHADGSVRKGRVIDRRTDVLDAIAVSPDGRRVVWGGRDKLIASEGRVPHVAERIAISEDGKEIVSAGSCGTLRLWDAVTGTPVWTVKASERTIFHVALSPDGRLVATSGADATVRLWDATTGAPVRALSKHPGTVYYVSFSPDGRRLASCGDHGKIYLWDVATGEPHELVGPTLGVFEVLWFPDGRRLLSCGLDKAIRFWDAGTGSELSRIDDAHGTLVGHLALSPLAKKILSQSWDGTVKVWDAATGALLRELPRAPRVCWPGCFLDERRAVVGCFDGTIRVLDTESGDVLEKLSLESSTDTPVTIVPCPGGRSVLVATGRGVILRFRIRP
jgi:WD40 repeat protein